MSTTKVEKPEFAKQGEVEDWQLTINEANTPPAPVPEPGTIFLLGIGLIGLAAGARKKFKK